MNRIFKRTDQMISVRRDQCFPETIAEVLSGIKGIGSEYSLVIHQKAGMNDQLNIRVNASDEIINDAGSRKTVFHEKIHSLCARHWD